MVIETNINYNFESDWFVELTDNKLSDDNLASGLVTHNQGNCNFYDSLIN